MWHIPLFWLLFFWGLVGLGRGWQALQERRTATFTPGHRRMELLWQAGLLATLLLGALYLSTLLEWLGWGALHHHPHHHDALLHPGHPPHSSVSYTVSLGLVAAVVLFLLWAVASPLRQRWRTHRHLVQLRCILAREAVELSYDARYTLASLQRDGSLQGPHLLVPGAWVGLVGTVRPVLLLGVELLAHLSLPELKAVLAHEAAHCRRKDPLYRFVYAGLARLVPGVGPRWLRQWQDEAELQCDRAASQTLQDPLPVASALVRVQRLQQEASRHPLSLRPVAATFLGQAPHPNLEQRVRALLRPSASSVPSASALRPLPLKTIALGLLLGCELLHQLFERLFHFVLSI